MLMSRHNSDTFVKSYNRECSIIHKKNQKNMSDTLTQPAVSTYTSGSKAQVQGLYVDPLLSLVPIFASSSDPGVSLQSSNIFAAKLHIQ